MPGANYMGGKRNVAKARARDTTTRKQKGFFGRKRLEILGKCLQIGRGPDRALEVERKTLQDVVSGIDLAHAKRLLPKKSAAPSFSSAETAYLTTKSRKNNTVHSSSSSSRSSRVIQALDESEPMFARAQVERIIQLPDLAGLPSRRRKLSETEHGSRPSRGPKRRKSQHLIPAEDDAVIGKVEQSGECAIPVSRSTRDCRDFEGRHDSQPPCANAAYEDEQRFYYDPERDTPAAEGQMNSDEFLLDLDSSLPCASSPNYTAPAQGDPPLSEFSLGLSDEACASWPSPASYSTCFWKESTPVSVMHGQYSFGKSYSPVASSLGLASSSRHIRSPLDRSPDFGEGSMSGNLSAPFAPGSTTDQAGKFSRTRLNSCLTDAERHGRPNRPRSTAPRLASPAIVDKKPQLQSPAPRPSAAGNTPASEPDDVGLNLLNGLDPWQAIGKLLGIQHEMQEDAMDVANIRTHDRRGVGYVEAGSATHPSPLQIQMQGRESELDGNECESEDDGYRECFADNAITMDLFKHMQEEASPARTRQAQGESSPMACILWRQARRSVSPAGTDDEAGLGCLSPSRENCSDLDWACILAEVEQEQRLDFDGRFGGSHESADVEGESGGGGHDRNGGTRPVYSVDYDCPASAAAPIRTEVNSPPAPLGTPEQCVMEERSCQVLLGQEDPRNGSRSAPATAPVISGNIPGPRLFDDELECSDEE